MADLSDGDLTTIIATVTSDQSDLSGDARFEAMSAAISAYRALNAAHSVGAEGLPDSSIDFWQRRGYLGTSDEWREACRLYRARCSPDDVAQMAKLHAYIEDGLLIVTRAARTAGR